MQLKPILKRLFSDSEFKVWKKSHPNHYLVHIFFMIDPPKNSQFDVGFFDIKSNTITTFLVSDNDIQIKPDQEVFKDPDHPIRALEPDQVKIEYDEAMKLSKAVQVENYKGQSPVKEIVILQNSEKGLVWNITFVTQTFKTLNIKIGADSGKVVEHKLHSLMDFNCK